MFMLRLATALSGWYRSTKLCTSPHFAQISRIKEAGTSSFCYEYCRRWYSQLIAPWCGRLTCSYLETQYVIWGALCSENFFI